MHSTNDLNDGYLGSGIRLWHSINKHGKENHQVEILEYLPDRKSLSNREKELVNEDLLKDTQCMNLATGGEHWTGVNSPEGVERRRHTFVIWAASGAAGVKRKREEDPEYDKAFKERTRKAFVKAREKSREKYPHGIFYGRKHSDEYKRKMKATLAERRPHDGEKNSQFGKMWIYNCDTLESVRIMKTESIPDGWVKGRKFQRPVFIQRESTFCPICEVEFTPLKNKSRVKFCGSDDCLLKIRQRSARKGRQTIKNKGGCLCHSAKQA
jgi:hypothetical protein